MMRSLRYALAAVAATACLLLPFAAKAGPIGPGCGTCFGNVYDLSYLVLSPDHFRITFEIDTSTTTLAASDFIAQVAFKPVSSSSDIVAALLVSTTAPGAWAQPTLGGLNNGGCTTGPQGFVCSTGGAPFLALTDGSTYSWLFDVTVADPAQWLLADFGASIKVNFGPGNGLITSETITMQTGCCAPPPPPPPIPEPGTLALAGLGLVGLVLVRRRKRQ